MVLSEVVQETIRLASIVQAESEGRIVAPGAFDDSTDRRLIEAEMALKDYLIRLPIATIYTLALIMYAGRGDFKIQSFLEQYSLTSETFTRPQMAVAQMVRKLMLPDYLRAGIAGLERAGLQLDTLMDN